MKSKRLLYIFPVLIILVAVTAFGYIGSYVSRWNDKIYPNCCIGGVDVSGLSLEEAKAALAKKNKSLSERIIKVVYGQREYILSYKELGAEMDLDSTLTSAYRYGKDSNVINKLFVLRSGKDQKYDINIKYNTEAVKQFIQRVKKEINTEPINALISIAKRGTPSVVKEVVGRKLDEEKLYNDIINHVDYSSLDTMTLDLKVSEIKPAITENTLKWINSQVSTVTTYYSTSTVGRAENIVIAASKLNGRLIMPGEEFSFNKETGSRTLENGFKGAPVIVKGKLVDGVAGGVCQVSTTLYNAVVKLGIKPLERRNHSLAPAYIGLGFDATVAEYIDYKFKNTLSYPLYIESKAGRGKVTFNIYSNSSVADIKYSLVNEVVEVLEPEIIYNSVDTIPNGSIEKVQEPIKGYKVKVYLVSYKNGKEIKRELLSKDNYKKVDGIYNVGI